jgi:hypothetical protein
VADTLDIEARTDHLIALLHADTRLRVGLHQTVNVGKGVPVALVENNQVWVAFYQLNGWEMWQAGQGGEMTVTWRIHFIWRNIGEPTLLEREVSRLTTNVVTILADHVNEAGFWQSLTIAGSAAINERTQDVQGHERQYLMIRAKWTSPSL